MAVLQLPEPIEPDMLRWMFHSLSTPLGSVDDAVTARGRAPRNHLEPGLLGLLASDLASTTCRAWAASRLTRGAVDTLSFLALGRPPRSGGGNRSFWSDTELDCWLDRARRVEQPSERKALYELVQRRLLRDLPVVFLWHEDNVVVLARGLEGAELSLRPDPAFLPRLVRLP